MLISAPVYNTRQGYNKKKLYKKNNTSNKIHIK